MCKALEAHVPWPALKVAASTPAASFKFVLPAELEAHIVLRSQQKFGATVRDAKRKKQAKSRKPAEKLQLNVDPLQL